MVFLQAQPTLALAQFLLQSFYDLTQNVCASTLWVCDHGVAQPISLDLEETETLLILKLQLHHVRGSLNLQITPETVLVSGERLDPLKVQTNAELAFDTARFQSLIPLPSSIEPQTAIAQLSDTTLTLTLMKTYKMQPTAKLTVGDRAQQLPYVVAVNATTVAALAEFH